MLEQELITSTPASHVLQQLTQNDPNDLLWHPALGSDWTAIQNNWGHSQGNAITIALVLAWRHHPCSQKGQHLN